MEGSRNRRSGERQDIDLSPELLQALLGSHSEAMLLIHNQQPQIPKVDILLEQAVGPDHDIDGAVTNAAQHLALLLAAAEAREHLHLDRKAAKPLGKRLSMLQGEDRSRDQDRRLLPCYD